MWGLLSGFYWLYRIVLTYQLSISCPCRTKSFLKALIVPAFEGAAIKE